MAAMSGTSQNRGAVILAEDDEHVRFGLMLSCENAGYSVISGTCVEIMAAAVDGGMTLGGRVRAVVTDWRLESGVNGLSVIRAVRNVCGQDLRAVMISADTSPATRDRIEAAGVVLLCKPFAFSELLAEIER